MVLNASAGAQDCAAAAQRLAELFGVDGRAAHIVLAEDGAALRKAARQAVRDGCDVLVAGGGDGTINTVAAEVVGTEIAFGVLPLGTLNHFAKDLGIPLDLEAAAQVVLSGTVTGVDVGEVNGRIFLNNSSLGVYPSLVRERERYQATGLGKWIAASWAALTVLRRHPFMAVRLSADAETIVRRTPFVFVGNNAYRMEGIHAGVRESLTGGHLAVYVMNATRRQGLVWLAFQVLLGRTEQIRELDTLTVREATIETKRRRLHVALDGEVTTLESPLRYRTRPGALRVVVPATGPGE